MIYNTLNKLFGQDITEIIYKKIYDTVLAELMWKRLKSEIRGERYVQSFDTSTNVRCLNCYAYGRTDQYGSHDCGGHANDIIGNVRKISYLEFIKSTAIIRTQFLYLHGRMQNDRIPDDEAFKHECTDIYIFKYNLDQIDR